jgi:hypothetical protein
MEIVWWGIGAKNVQEEKENLRANTVRPYKKPLPFSGHVALWFS